MSIPFHDEQVLPPEARVLSTLQQNLLISAFYSERDRAFTPAMEESDLIFFYKKYKISFPLPWLGGKRNLPFWVMSYVAALASKAGPPPEAGEPHLPGDQLLSATTIKAEIWLYRMQAQHLADHKAAFSWNVKQGTYSINQQVYGLHPLLKLKRGEPYVHLLPRSSSESS